MSTCDARAGRLKAIELAAAEANNNAFVPMAIKTGFNAIHLEFIDLNRRLAGLEAGRCIVTLKPVTQADGTIVYEGTTP